MKLDAVITTNMLRKTSVALAVVLLCLSQFGVYSVWAKKSDREKLQELLSPVYPVNSEIKMNRQGNAQKRMQEKMDASIHPVSFRQQEGSVQTNNIKLISTLELESVQINQEPQQVASYLRTGISMSNTASVRLNPKLIVRLLASENRDVAIASEIVEQYKWGVPYVGSRLLPSVSGQYIIDKLTGATVILNQTPVGIRRLNQKPSVNLGYRFAARSIFDLKAAHAQYKRSKSQYDRTLQEQMLKGLTQYYTWLKDISANGIAKQSLVEAEEQHKQNQIRFEAGFGTQLDIEQAAVLSAERESDLLQAENSQVISGVALANTLNIPLEYPVFPEEAFIEPIVFLPGLTQQPLSQLFAMAEVSRPDLKDLTYLIKEAKATFWANVSDVIPTVNMNANFGNTGPQRGQFNRMYQRNLTVDATLLNNLGLGLLSRAKMDKARIREAILTKEKELATIKNDIAKAYFDVRLYRRQMGVMNKKVHSAGEALRITKARQKHGVGIHLETVQAETKLAEARQEYLNAVMKYNNAQLQLLFEIGQLTPDRLLIAYDVHELPTQEQLIEQSKHVPKPSAIEENKSINALAIVENESEEETNQERLDKLNQQLFLEVTR